MIIVSKKNYKTRRTTPLSHMLERGQLHLLSQRPVSPPVYMYGFLRLLSFTTGIVFFINISLSNNSINLEKKNTTTACVNLF